MTIENFFTLICFVVWGYFIGFIAVKIKHDNSGHRKEEKARLLINDFFKSADEKKYRKIERYIEEDSIFDYYCICYISAKDSFKGEEKAKYEKLTEKIIERKIRLSEKEDAYTKCMIAMYIKKCGIINIEQQAFMKKCMRGSQLEREYVGELENIKEA